MCVCVYVDIWMYTCMCMCVCVCMYRGFKEEVVALNQTLRAGFFLLPLGACDMCMRRYNYLCVCMWIHGCTYVCVCMYESFS